MLARSAKEEQELLSSNNTPLKKAWKLDDPSAPSAINAVQKRPSREHDSLSARNKTSTPWFIDERVNPKNTESGSVFVPTQATFVDKKCGP